MKQSVDAPYQPVLCWHSLLTQPNQDTVSTHPKQRTFLHSISRNPVNTLSKPLKHNIKTPVNSPNQLRWRADYMVSITAGRKPPYLPLTAFSPRRNSFLNTVDSHQLARLTPTNTAYTILYPHPYPLPLSSTLICHRWPPLYGEILSWTW